MLLLSVDWRYNVKRVLFLDVVVLILSLNLGCIGNCFCDLFVVKV